MWVLHLPLAVAQCSYMSWSSFSGISMMHILCTSFIYILIYILIIFKGVPFKGVIYKEISKILWVLHKINIIAYLGFLIGIALEIRFWDCHWDNITTWKVISFHQRQMIRTRIFIQLILVSALKPYLIWVQHTTG